MIRVTTEIVENVGKFTNELFENNLKIVLNAKFNKSW